MRSLDAGRLGLPIPRPQPLFCVSGPPIPVPKVPKDDPDFEKQACSGGLGDRGAGGRDGGELAARTCGPVAAAAAGLARPFPSEPPTTTHTHTQTKP